MEYTEREAIEIAMECGVGDGSEFETAAWKQRGCLKPDRTLKALISKLKTIYNIVEVVGNGKKRTYILNDKKEKRTERQFNYKGKVLTEYDEVMKEYIFNQLVANTTDNNYSYKGWAEKLKLPNLLSAASKKFYIDNVKDYYMTKDEVVFNASEVVSECFFSIDMRNRDVIKNSFNTLLKEGRIHIDNVYISILNNNGTTVFETIEEEKYNQIIIYIRETLSTYGVSYFEYTNFLNKKHGSVQVEKVTQIISDHLKSTYQIDRVYKSYKVTLLENTIMKDIKIEQFNAAYFTRLVKLSKDRQNKKSYRCSDSFWKKFYYLSMLLVLKSSQYYIEDIEKLFEEESENKKDIVFIELFDYDGLFA